MSIYREVIKPRLRYHRIVVLSLVLLYIFYKYNFSERANTYPNGQIKYEGEYINGMNEGMWTWYYENGQKQIQGAFKKGRRTGVWKMWNLNGTLVSEKSYVLDKLNGPYMEWYDNSRKKAEGFFLEDKLNGVNRCYDTTGKLRRLTFYQDGNLIKTKYDSY